MTKTQEGTRQAGWAANLGLFLTAIFWGSLVPILSSLLERWDPYFLSALRYGLPVPIFLVLVWIREPGPLIPPGTSLRRLLALGGALAAFSTLYTVGVAHANPITAAIVSACSPIVAGIVAWIGTRTPPQRTLYLAVPLAVAGGVLSTLDITGIGASVRLGGGEPLIVAGSVCWACYSIGAQRWLGHWSLIRISALTITPCAVLLVAWYGMLRLAGLTRPLPTAWAADVPSLAWVTFAAVVAGILLWNHGVRILGVVVAALYLNLIPVVALVVAAWMGTRPRLEQLVGAALVVAAVAQAQLRRRSCAMPPVRVPPSQGP